MNFSLKVVFLIAACLAVAHAGGGGRGGRRRPKPKPCRVRIAEAEQRQDCYPSQYFDCVNLPQEMQRTRGNLTVLAVCLPKPCDGGCPSGTQCRNDEDSPPEDDSDVFQQCFPDKPSRRPGGSQRGDGQQGGAQEGASQEDGVQGGDGQRGGRPRGGGRRGNRRRGGSGRNRRQADENPFDVPRCSLPAEAKVASKACQVNGVTTGQCKRDGSCNATLACTVTLGGQSLQLNFCNRPERTPPTGGNQDPPRGNPPSDVEPLVNDPQGEETTGQRDRPNGGRRQFRRGGGRPRF